ncbi:MAG: hypothetical protein BroJett003_08890 [Planctomycetota bacterium]|nr:MAG: hypothetical protein BroJett003_08890 [Planctomycetota bacterium]
MTLPSPACIFPGVPQKRATATAQARSAPGKKRDAGRIVVHPLTPDRWSDIEALFGARGACGGCWCTYWRKTRPEYERGKGDANRAHFRAVVKDGEHPPGVIAYIGGKPVGWCAVAPREEYVRLRTSRVLKPVDDQPVWAVTCFYIDRTHRGRGLSVALLKGATDLARRAGAEVVEGYPVDPRGGRQADVFVYTGLASAFLRAGFKEVARRSPTRPILRKRMTKQGAPKPRNSVDSKPSRAPGR